MCLKHVFLLVNLTLSGNPRDIIFIKKETEPLSEFENRFQIGASAPFVGETKKLCETQNCEIFFFYLAA